MIFASEFSNNLKLDVVQKKQILYKTDGGRECVSKMSWPTAFFSVNAAKKIDRTYNISLS